MSFAWPVKPECKTLDSDQFFDDPQWHAFHLRQIFLLSTAVRLEHLSELTRIMLEELGAFALLTLKTCCDPCVGKKS